MPGWDLRSSNRAQHMRQDRYDLSILCSTAHAAGFQFDFSRDWQHLDDSSKGCSKDGGMDAARMVEFAMEAKIAFFCVERGAAQVLSHQNSSSRCCSAAASHDF